MPATRLGKRTIDALAPRGKPYIAYDADLKGFGVRVLPSGAKSWIIEYRPGGGGRRVGKRRMTIGPVGTLTPDEARNASRTLLASIRLGVDPLAERDAKRGALSVADLADRYMREHVMAKRKKSTVSDYRYYLSGHVVPAFGRRPAAEVTRADIARLHLSMRATPYRANRVLAFLSAMYSWGMRYGLLSDGANPATRIDKFPEKPRERYLSADEMQRLGDALRRAETIGFTWEPDPAKKAKHAPKNRQVIFDRQAVAAICLLLFTGCRLREVLHLKWREVDFDRGLLFLKETKTGPKAIVLNAPALEVLQSLPQSGGFVIPGIDPEAPDGLNPNKPRADLKRPWDAIIRHAGIENFRLHDLRHCFASVGVCNGLGLPIVGKLLGHTQASTTQRYAHLDTDPLRRASNAIAGILANAIGHPPGSPPPAGASASTAGQARADNVVTFRPGMRR